jgi:site-specific DNA-methyltransferase (adenine-specific)
MALILNGNCLEKMKEMADNSVDSIVTDPPYGLSFMGKKWDYDVPSVAIWGEALRVLKPGGHLLAFSGSRTYHRMVVNIEDAGFEVRDQIMWIYGSGFPKSLNISKAIDKHLGVEREKVRVDYHPNQMLMREDLNDRPWMQKAKELGYHELAGDKPASPEAEQWDGWGTALKPAHEPIVLARKPPIGTLTENVLEHGIGGLNIDASRIGHNDPDIERKDTTSPTTELHFSGDRAGERGAGPAPEGRFPANILHDGSEEVLARFPEAGGGFGIRGAGRSIYGDGLDNEIGQTVGFGDSGSAARFFKEAQFSKQEMGRFPANVIHDGSQEVVDNFPNTNSTVPSEANKRGGDFPSENTIKLGLKEVQRTGFSDEGSAARYFKEVSFSKQEGRFPANVIHDGSEEVLEQFPETGKSAGGRIGNAEGAFSGLGETGFTTEHEKGDPGFGDSGSAARYFKEVSFSKQEHEPIVLARKPLEGTVAENVLEHDTGGLNIDESRVQYEQNDRLLKGGSYGGNRKNQGGESIFGNGGGEASYEEGLPSGRFPANIIHDGSEEVLEGFPHTTSGDGKPHHITRESQSTSMSGKNYGGRTLNTFGDSGSAARFFYCAKASKSERNAGLEEFDERQMGRNQSSLEGGKMLTGSGNERSNVKQNFHPTVKPIALMEYLCRMITPRGGVVLDPFMGSGTTGIAALRLGFEFIGIEMDKDYADLATARIAHWVDMELEFDDEEVMLKRKPQAEWL